MKYRYKTETLNICWINAEDSLPKDCTSIYFQLKESKKIKQGIYSNCLISPFTTDIDMYNENEVSYWCYIPEVKGV